MPVTRLWHQTEILAALRAGAWVVTAGERLARAVRLAFGEDRQAAGAAVWERPQVLSYGSFLKQLHEQSFAAALSAAGNPPPRRMPDPAAAALWEDCVHRSGIGGELLQPAATAADAYEAWKLCSAYRIPLERIEAGEDEDAHQFATWAGEFVARSRKQGWLEEPRLSDWLTSELRQGRLAAPARLVLAGFDELTPQQQELMEVLRARGCDAQVLEIQSVSAATAMRIRCADTRAELKAAARWARAQLLREPAARIGIVAQDLEACRTALAAELDDALSPGALLQDSPSRPYNFSLGQPLAATPVVHAALALLELLRPQFTFASASLLLRSPFLQGADSERAARARLDLGLRGRMSETLTRRGLLGLTAAESGCRAWAALLQSLQQAAEMQPATQKPSAWAACFAEVLERCGWPGERGADSGEFQAVKAFREQLSDWVQLDRALGSINLNQALARLRRLATDAMFQPESADEPVQVLGLLETAGLRFDHLWILGLTDDNWPESPRPRAFIPLRLQKHHGVPHSSAALELKFAETLTRRLLASASQVVVSTPQREADTELRPSPLLAELPMGEPQAGPEVLSYKEQLQQCHATAIESYADEKGPALTGSQQAGGTQVIRLQAACPFQAFAWQRLGAEPLAEPSPGPDPLERGKLMHLALQLLWANLKTHSALAAMDPGQREAAALSAAEQAVSQRTRKAPEIYTPRLAELERGRLQQLLSLWLGEEASRPPFKVAEREAKQPLKLGPLSLSIRVDRIDELPAGGRLLLDYKTGRASLQGWLDARPDEPQLPLYAIANRDGLKGLAFASLRPGEMRFDGLGAEAGLAAGIQAYAAYKYRPPGVDSWENLLSWWQKNLERLAADYAAGEAQVAPKNAQTCERCHLTTLCRIHSLAEAPPESAHED